MDGHIQEIPPAPIVAPSSREDLVNPDFRPLIDRYYRVTRDVSYRTRQVVQSGVESYTTDGCGRQVPAPS